MKKIFILAILVLGLHAQDAYICVAINVGTIDNQKSISQEYRDNMDESESGKLFFLDDKTIVDGQSTKKYNLHTKKNNLLYYSSEENTETEVLTVMIRDEKLFIRSVKPSRTPMLITYQCSNPKNKSKKVVKSAPISNITNDKTDKQKFYEENLDKYAFCAANYFVRTTTPKDQKALSEMIQSYGMTSQYIGSLYFSKIYKKTASKGTMFEYREKHLLLLEKDFRDDRKLSKETLHKIAKCDGKIVYLSNNPSVYSDIDKSFVYSEKSDKLFQNELAITTQKPAIIDEKRILESFKIWIDDHNGTTPLKILKMLKEKENK